MAHLIQLYSDKNKTQKAYPLVHKDGIVDGNGEKIIDLLNEKIVSIEDRIMKEHGYSDEYFRNFFAMQRTGKKYTTRYPLWETSTVATGEKLDDHQGLVIEASTKTYKGRDDYENIPLFKTYDVNADIHLGKIRVLSIKGDEGFNDTEVDTFVLGMPYYEKVWCDDQYMYISRSDVQHEGYTLCREGRYPNGKVKDFCLYAKYQAGRNLDDVLGSFKNAKPQRNMSHNNNITEGTKRGEGYTFGMACDIQYLQNTFLIKYADRNFNNKLGGCFGYNIQTNVTIPEENTTRVVIAASQANNIIIGSYVSVGELGDDTNKDRGSAKAHNLCDSVKVLDIVVVDDTNKALVLDVDTPFTTTLTTLISTMHYQSGYSDEILGRDGCYCTDKSQISSLKFPSVLQGIELCVGGYEVLGNAFMDIVDANTRDIYICNNTAKLTTNVTTAKSTYMKLERQMHVETNNQWNYVTQLNIDVTRGITVAEYAGASGSGSGTGYCDGIYFDSGTSGQRVFLCFGYLWSWAYCGLFYVNGHFALSIAWWSCLSRLSFNGFGGESLSVA